MYIQTFLTLVSLDFFWLSHTRSLYGPAFDKMNATLSPNFILYAIYTYLLIALGIEYLLVTKADLWVIPLFGLIVYGVYDGTMLATFDNYDINIAIIDNIWGAVLCTMVVLLVLLQNKVYKYIVDKINL